MSFPELLFLLIAGHALADFSLQHPAMGKGKNWQQTIDPNHVPPGQKAQTVWPYWLTAHSLIHGGVVYIITGYWVFGLFEAWFHWMIDYGKCSNWYGIHTDQFLHILCKILYAYTIVVVN